MTNHTDAEHDVAPPRVLVVATIHNTLSAFLLPIGEHFRRLGWRVDAAAAGAPGNAKVVAAFDEVFDVALSRSPRALSNLTTAPAQLRKILRENDYDLVHVHTPIAGTVVRFVLRNLRRRGRPKVVYTAHGFLFYPGAPRLKEFIYRNHEKLCGRWTDELIVINREDEDAARRHRLVPPEHLHYMPGIGVDLDLYDAAAISDEQTGAVRGELGLAEGDNLLVMPANFDPGKRHIDLLDAMVKLGRPNVHAAFAGLPGPREQPLREEVAKRGLDRQIHFLGFRSDIPTLLRAADAMVLPSEREGLPRSVMEAMALGVPVVVARYRGWADLIGDDCGRSSDVGDSAGLACELAWVLDHPSEAAAMAERAKIRIRRHSLARILEMHQTLYAKTLGRPELAPDAAPMHSKQVGSSVAS